MAPLLKIALLGPFEVTLDGKPLVGFATMKTRALLAYLVVERDHQHTRESLAALLWPDHSDQDALHNLRLTLSRLRQTLALAQGDDGLTESPYLMITRQTVQIHPHAPVQVDVAEFGRLLSASEAHGHPLSQPCQACMQQRVQAAALYRGNFLQDLSIKDALGFEEWVVLRRENYHRQALEALDILTGHYLAQYQNGAWNSREASLLENARDFAHRQLQLEPWRESAHRQLMLALALDGETQNALLQYQACQRVLMREFGIQAGEETTRLHQLIREGKLFIRPNLQPAPTIIPNNLPQPATPFIGREAELRRLNHLLFAPEYRWITLVGESGVGKTRLALAALKQVMPYFRDGVWYISLANICPPDQQEGSSEAYVDTLALTIAAAIHFRFYQLGEPFRQLLDFLRQKRLLLLLDGFDPIAAGAEFILDLLQAAPEVSIVTTNRQLRNFQAGYVMRVEGFPVVEDENDPLALRQASVQLFADRSGQAIRNTTAADTLHICQMMDGLPLGIELAAVQAGETSVAAVARELDLRVPAQAGSFSAILAVLECAWSDLKPPERLALLQCSIFPRDFDQRASLTVTRTGTHALDALVAKHLVQRLDSDRYQIHELVLQFLSRKIAERELQPSGFIGLFREDTPLSQRLEEARERYSEYYLNIFSERETDLLGSASSQELSILWAEADHLRQAWRWAVDTIRLPNLESILTTLSHLLDQPELAPITLPALDTAVQMIAKFESNGTPYPERQALLARFYLLRARWFVLQGSLTPGLELSQQAIALGRSLGRSDLQAEGLLYTGIALYQRDDLNNARGSLQQTITLLAPDMQPTLQAEAQLYLGLLAIQNGQPEQAGEHFQHSLRLYSQINHKAGQGNAQCRLADLLENQGTFEAAQEMWLEALKSYRNSGAGDCRASLADFYTRQYAFDAALAQWEKAIEAAQYLGDRTREVTWSLEYCQVLVLVGKYNEARVCCEQTLRLARSSANPLLESRTLSCLAMVCNTLEDYEIAEAHARLALQLAQKMVHVEGQALASLVLGTSLEALGETTTAAELYRVILSSTPSSGDLPGTSVFQPALLTASWALEAQAGLARLSPSMRAVENLAQMEELLRQLQPAEKLRPWPGLFSILRTCTRLQKLAVDPQAAASLDTLRRKLERRASRCGDSNLRQAFIAQIRQN